jgi:hypothetical protein
MRYFFAVPALPIGLGEAPCEGAPMSTAGLANRPLPADQTAPLGAVLLTTVTRSTQEDLLPALGELADDQAERIHGVPGVRATKLAASVGPCEEEELILPCMAEADREPGGANLRALTLSGLPDAPCSSPPPARRRVSGYPCAPAESPDFRGLRRSATGSRRDPRSGARSGGDGVSPYPPCRCEKVQGSGSVSKPGGYLGNLPKQSASWYMKCRTVDGRSHGAAP